MINAAAEPRTPPPDPPAPHLVRRWVTLAGYSAACSPCRWGTTCRSREQRDRDVDAHLTDPVAALVDPDDAAQ